MAEPIKLPPRIDVSNAGELAESLRAASQLDMIRLDASDVTHFGALGVQIVLSAARTIRTKGGAIEITGMGERALEQLAAMGLTQETLVEGAI